MEPWPVTSNRRSPNEDAPYLEYKVTLTTPGPIDVTAYVSPRNNVFPTDGLKYAVSIDGGTPETVNITTQTGANDTTMNRQWERNTSDNVNRTTTRHELGAAGTHTLRFWMVDPTVVLQNLVVDTGVDETQPAKPLVSYLGPPESLRRN